MKPQVAELEHQLRHRLRPGLGQRRSVGGEAPVQGDEDVVDSGRGAAGGAADRDVGGCLIEIARQGTGFRAVECQQDHGKSSPTPLGLQLEPVLQLPGHPIRFKSLGAHQHRQTSRSLNRRLDLTFQRIATAQLPRINPHLLPQISQCRPQLPHEAIVGAAVGEEEVGHRRGVARCAGVG